MPENDSSGATQDTGAPDRESIYRRLQQMVDEAIRQQRIEQTVWSVFLELCALLLVVVGLGLVARFIYIEYEVRNRPVPQALFAFVTVYGPEPSAAITRFEKELVVRIETASNPEVLRDTRSFGLTGKVGISVVLAADGKLGAVNLSRPSGDETLNRAACRALMTQIPFEALPVEMRNHEKTAMTVFITIDHSVVKKAARVGPRGKVRRSCTELLNDR